LWDDISHAGVDLDDVAGRLEQEGVSSFQRSFDELIAALGAKAKGYHRNPR
jgi:transaldolase